MGVMKGMSALEDVCFVAIGLTLSGETCRDIRTGMTYRRQQQEWKWKRDTWLKQIKRP